MDEKDNTPSIKPDQEINQPSTEEVMIKKAAALGFRETEKMQSLREQIHSVQELADFINLLKEYQILGEQEVDKLTDDVRPKAQIALILTSAGIYNFRGMEEAFSEAVEDAIIYAENMGYGELVEKLDALMRQLKTG